MWAEASSTTDVEEAVAPSESWITATTSWPQRSEGATASSASVVEEASAHIARYKLPKDVVFVDVIQRSPSGKADYRWAAETAVKAATEGAGT
jgi:acyl-CoA synthetase (AMP-forming)/AMP-acid ligase II